MKSLKYFMTELNASLCICNDAASAHCKEVAAHELEKNATGQR